MQLRSILQTRILEARRAKDTLRANVLKQVHAEIIKADHSQGTKVDDEQILERCKKKWGKAIEEYKRLLCTAQSSIQRSKLQEAMDKEAAELEIIKSLSCNNDVLVR